MAAASEALLASQDPPVRGRPHRLVRRPALTGAVSRRRPTVAPARLLLDQRAGHAVKPAAAELDVTRPATSGSTANERALTAQAGQILLFFLTILLAGMLLSQLIEEKSNKIIEVLAAAVPVDAMFLGKLFAMLAASVLGIIVWAGAGAAADRLFLGTAASRAARRRRSAGPPS